MQRLNDKRKTNMRKGGINSALNQTGESFWGKLCELLSRIKL